MGAEFNRQALGQAAYTMLRSNVVSNARPTLIPCGRGQVNDHTPLLSNNHALSSFPPSNEGPAQIDIEHTVPLLIRHFNDRAEGINTSVIHPDINATKFLYRLGCHLSD